MLGRQLLAAVPRPLRGALPGRRPLSRADEGLLYGVHPVLEALKARPEAVREVLTSRDLDRGGTLGEIGQRAREQDLPIRRVGRAELDRLVGGRNHQGVALRLERAVPPEVTDPLALVDAARAAGRDPLLLVLDGIQDPHNLGALVRSAHAFGADGVIVPKDRATDLTPTAIKASAGAAAHLPVVKVVNLARTLADLKEAGVWVAGADPRGNESLAEVDLSGPMALVIGAEGRGIRRLVLEACDRRVNIPMRAEMGSINASVAGALFLWEAVRRRRAPGAGPRGT